MNVGGARETFVTLDYGAAMEPENEATTTLFLTRAKPRPMPAIVDKRGLVTMYGRATTTGSFTRVPRLSLLVRLDKQQRTALTRMRRTYFFAVGIVFAIGMLAGAFATRPALRGAVAPVVASVASVLAR